MKTEDKGYKSPITLLIHINLLKWFIIPKWEYDFKTFGKWGCNYLVEATFLCFTIRFNKDIDNTTSKL